MSSKDKRAFFQVDVGYFDNPKLADLVEDNPQAVILHLRAIAYSAQHLTDGIFPTRLVMRLACAPRCGPQCGSHCQPQCALGLLVQCGLVNLLDDGTAEVHDYLKHQRSAESIGKAKAAGQRAAKARWKAEPDADRIADRIAEPMRTAMPREKEREKERTTTKDLSTGDAVGPATPDTFLEFWDAYPRKEVKKKSIPAYRSALKRASAEQLLKGAERYRDDPNRDPGYTALATTWLTGDRWEDDPLPPRSGKQSNDQKVHSGLTLTQQLYAEEQNQIAGHTQHQIGH